MSFSSCSSHKSVLTDIENYDDNTDREIFMSQNFDNDENPSCLLCVRPSIGNSKGENINSNFCEFHQPLHTTPQQHEYENDNSPLFHDTLDKMCHGLFEEDCIQTK